MAEMNLGAVVLRCVKSHKNQKIVGQNFEKPLKCVHTIFFAGFLIF